MQYEIKKDGNSVTITAYGSVLPGVPPSRRLKTNPGYEVGRTVNQEMADLLRQAHCFASNTRIGGAVDITCYCNFCIKRREVLRYA